MSRGAPARVSLASDFEVKGGEVDAEGLKEPSRVRQIHVKVLLAHAPKLHVYLFVVLLVYQLKVLDGGLIHAPIDLAQTPAPLPPQKHKAAVSNRSR